MVELKVMDIHKARTYIYQDGEAERIANRKFDRAIKDGTLNKFPNVPFFQKKKEAELAKMKEILITALQEDDRELARSKIPKLEDDLKVIAEYLKKDLRLSKWTNSDGVQLQTVDNIEDLEANKLYHQWVESQAQGAVQRKAHDRDFQTFTHVAVPINPDIFDAKQQLFAEIQSIKQNELLSEKLGVSNSGHSFYEMIEASKKRIVDAHKKDHAKLDVETLK